VPICAPRGKGSEKFSGKKTQVERGATQSRKKNITERSENKKEIMNANAKRHML